MNVVPGNVFFLCCTKTNGCVHQTFCCIARMNRGCTCSPSCNAPADCAILQRKHQHVSASVIFTSEWPLHNLIRKLYSPSRQTETHYHTDTVCVNCSPHPNFPNLDSTDLYQAALVNMPWGMKLANIRAHCTWGAAMWHVLVPHEHLHT